MADGTEIKEFEKELCNEVVVVEGVIGESEICETDKKCANGVVNYAGKYGEVSVLVTIGEQKNSIEVKTEIVYKEKSSEKLQLNQVADCEREEGELVSESEDEKEQETVIDGETTCIDAIEFNVSQEDLEFIGSNEEIIYGDHEEGEVISIRSEHNLEFKDEFVVNDDEYVKREEIEEIPIEKGIIEESIPNVETEEVNNNDEATEYLEDGEIQSPNDNEPMLVYVDSKYNSMFGIEIFSVGDESTKETKVEEEELHCDNAPKQSSEMKNPCQSYRAPALATAPAEAPLHFDASCSLKTFLNDDHEYQRRHYNDSSNGYRYGYFDSDTKKQTNDYEQKRWETAPISSSGEYDNIYMISGDSLPVCMEVDVVDSSTIQNSIVDIMEKEPTIVTDNTNDVDNSIASVQQQQPVQDRNTKNIVMTYGAPGINKPKRYDDMTSHVQDRKPTGNSPPVCQTVEETPNDTDQPKIYGPQWLFPSPKRIELSESEDLYSSPPPRLFRKERALRSFIKEEGPHSRRSKPYDKPLQPLQPLQPLPQLLHPTHIKPHVEYESQVQHQHQHQHQHQPQPQPQPQLPPLPQHQLQLQLSPATPPRKKIRQPYCPFTMRGRLPPNTVTMYDERGRLRSNGADICDCGYERCEGCWYNCFECGSSKCGLSCRCNRYSYPDRDSCR